MANKNDKDRGRHIESPETKGAQELAKSRRLKALENQRDRLREQAYRQEIQLLRNDLRQNSQPKAKVSQNRGGPFQKVMNMGRMAARAPRNMLNKVAMPEMVQSTFDTVRKGALASAVQATPLGFLDPYFGFSERLSQYKIFGGAGLKPPKNLQQSGSASLNAYKKQGIGGRQAGTMNQGGAANVRQQMIQSQRMVRLHEEMILSEREKIQTKQEKKIRQKKLTKDLPKDLADEEKVREKHRRRSVLRRKSIELDAEEELKARAKARKSPRNKKYTQGDTGTPVSGPGASVSNLAVSGGPSGGLAGGASGGLAGGASEKHLRDIWTILKNKEAQEKLDRLEAEEVRKIQEEQLEIQKWIKRVTQAQIVLKKGKEYYQRFRSAGKIEKWTGGRKGVLSDTEREELAERKVFSQKEGESIAQRTKQIFGAKGRKGRKQTIAELNAEFEKKAREKGESTKAPGEGPLTAFSFGKKSPAIKTQTLRVIADKVTVLQKRAPGEGPKANIGMEKEGYVTSAQPEKGDAFSHLGGGGGGGLLDTIMTLMGLKAGAGTLRKLLSMRRGGRLTRGLLKTRMKARRLWRGRSLASAGRKMAKRPGRIGQFGSWLGRKGSARARRKAGLGAVSGMGAVAGVGSAAMIASEGLADSGGFEDYSEYDDMGGYDDSGYTATDAALDAADVADVGSDATRKPAKVGPKIKRVPKSRYAKFKQKMRIRKMRMKRPPKAPRILRVPKGVKALRIKGPLGATRIIKPGMLGRAGGALGKLGPLAALAAAGYGFGEGALNPEEITGRELSKQKDLEYADRATGGAANMLSMVSMGLLDPKDIHSTGEKVGKAMANPLKAMGAEIENPTLKNLYENLNPVTNAQRQWGIVQGGLASAKSPGVKKEMNEFHELVKKITGKEFHKGGREIQEKMSAAGTWQAAANKYHDQLGGKLPTEKPKTKVEEKKEELAKARVTGDEIGAAVARFLEKAGAKPVEETTTPGASQNLAQNKSFQFGQGVSEASDVKGGFGVVSAAGAAKAGGLGWKAAEDLKKKALGEISKKYESGSSGAGTVSSGVGDLGGVSYGTYQFSSRSKGGGKGTVSKFLKSTGYASAFAGLEPGSKEFSARWKELAASDPNFEKAQHDFIKASHYDPQVKKISEETGLDVSKRSRAVQEAVWSIGVQHGAGSSVVSKALKGKDVNKMSDEEILNSIYDERSKRGPGGELSYFKSSSQAVQSGVASRFDKERKELLAMAAAEKTPGAGSSGAVPGGEMAAVVSPASPVVSKKEPVDTRSYNMVMEKRSPGSSGSPKSSPSSEPIMARMPQAHPVNNSPTIVRRKGIDDPDLWFINMVSFDI